MFRIKSRTVCSASEMLLRTVALKTNSFKDFDARVLKSELTRSLFHVSDVSHLGTVRRLSLVRRRIHPPSAFGYYNDYDVFLTGLALRCLGVRDLGLTMRAEERKCRMDAGTITGGSF